MDTRTRTPAFPLAARLAAAVAVATLAVTAPAAPAAAVPSTDGPGTLACTSIPANHDPSIIVIVHRVGLNLRVNDKVMLAGFETGWVESHMNNLPCGDKSSLGVFQQRWDYGWGTPEQIMDPVYSSTQFFTRAITCDRNNPGYTAGQVAQCVQRSGFPDRYDQSQAKARSLLAEASRVTGMAPGSPTDFSGDGKDDIVAFTQGSLNDVYVATSTGSSFTGTSVKWNDFFGLNGETLTTGDFNGDGKDDIIAFTHGSLADVYVALSTGTSFAPATKWHDWFAPGAEVATTGDVNGDGKDDIITFTHDNTADVYVALSTGTSFAPAIKWHDYFSIPGEHPATGDVNGDGKDDIITFTQGPTTASDVIIALSNGTTFGTPQKWHDLFAVGTEQPRVGDINGDGKDDIVTFTCNTDADVYAATSTGTTFTGTTIKWHDHFCLPGEFPYLADANGDGKDDIIVFTKGTTNDVHVALSTGTTFTPTTKWHDFFGLPQETTL
ncbi:VCBS repeat-containing protein [Micromonospora sp. NBC_01655]|uniref:FG-GAP repeat domain-containing protein n=1 Tax=Micromonospora sp. NBC_01655 TaxID=2975983 RepID=UPI0022515320|nr:VCBS repeat-containing protein [Micromonospora sp. NBC_01655]MCX4472458.1 VCBS repeat-containing protein [Micromonospora sp. NBC_01655]